MTAQTYPPQAVTTSPLPTLPLSTLTTSGLNPRAHFDEAATTELAQSILEQGVLQNLVVRPHPEEEGVWQLVAGERRYRALQHLLAEGKVDADYPVPVVVREVDDHELLLLATAENVQRQDMTPLEEADAFAKLMALGDTEEGIALRTGVAVSTVRLRLKLASGLCADARRALEAEQLTLSQAQALLLASKGLQKELLPRILENDYSPKDIKRLLTQDKVPVGRNVFPLEAYTDAKGSITRDIFQSEHPGWFDDRELFIRLQNEAVEQKMAAYQEQGLEVEVTRYFMPYQYVEGEGVVIVLNDYDVSVEFKEGFVKRPEPRPTSSPVTQTGGETKPKENRRRNEWEATTLTRALHVEAAKNFRLCLVLNIMALLGVRGFDLKREEGKAAQPGPANRIVSEELRASFENDLSRLTEGFEGPELSLGHPRGNAEPYPPTLEAHGEGVTHIFDTLRDMSDEDLQALFSRLTALTISHTNSDALWNTEVKKLVARATGLDVAEHFDASDPEYLALHTKAELGELARNAGVALDVTTLKKQVAVEYLSQHEKVRAFVPERLRLEAVSVPEQDE
jgi:ParB family transcriptional regulator, chromosome partitioning protein